MKDLIPALKDFLKDEINDASERAERAEGYKSALLKIYEFIRDYEENHE